MIIMSKPVPEDFNPREVLASMDLRLEVGQTWYLLSIDWFAKFKDFFGINPFACDAGDRDASTSSSPSTSSGSHPGPIDNRPLLDSDGCLKRCLVDNTDYVMVPEKAWLALVSAFGEVDEKTAIPRKVIETGMYVRQKRVEVYPIRLKLFLHPETAEKIEEFSILDTVASLKRRLMKSFDVSESADVRVYLRGGDPSDNKLLKPPTSTLENHELNDMDEIVLEVKPSSGTWTYNRLDNSDYTSSSLKSTSRRSIHQPGVCGLQNLGNTCFMNSVLQCVSNTPPITAYFLCKRHLEELNTENPLGTKGELAKSFGDLMEQMWSGNYSSVVPRNFKTQVSRYAPQFSGCLQHDAHELLIFLLDGLHEDLNRIRKKPYIELKEAEGRPDKVVAREAWENYLKRNDSIMVEIFHGMLKSTVVCPDCNKVSVTFDPNPPWALPLPYKRERNVNVIVVPKEPRTKPTEFRVSVPRDGALADVAEVIAHNGDVANVSSDSGLNLKLATMSGGSFSRIFGPTDRVSDLSDRERLFVYDVSPSPSKSKSPSALAEKTKSVVVPVLFRWHETASSRRWSSFGTPFFVRLRSEPALSATELIDILTWRMSRVYTPPEAGSRWWEDAGASSAVNGLNGGGSGGGAEAMEVDDEDGTEVAPFTVSFLDKDGDEMASWESISCLNDENRDVKLPDEEFQLAVDWHPLAVSRKLLDKEALNDCTLRTSLPLTGPKKGPIELRDCFKHFVSIETLRGDNAWYCPTCKVHQEATKKIDIWTLPDILIVQLKRFSYTRYSRDKLEAMVSYPTRGLDLREFVMAPDHPEPVYDLIGVSNHYGGLGGGHYTAYCRNKDDGHWYHFDDSSVSRVGEAEVVSKAGYVLFYQRRGSRVAVRYPSISGDEQHGASTADGW